MIGRTIDAYRILRLIGKGGMAEVYEAEHIVLRQQYALKIFAPAVCGDTPEQRARFLAEARIMARLDHPNIIKVLNFGETDGRRYLIEELAQTSLAEKLADEATAPDEKEIHSIARQILAAVEYAHAAGVIHRDLKPDNILFRKTGTVAVSDFGIAKILPESYWALLTHAAQSLTLENGEHRRGLGTVNYAAPEQIHGAQVSALFDIYSFGVILYEMLTGILPLRKWRPPSYYGVNRKWDLIAAKCLAVDARERFQSASELRMTMDRSFDRNNHHSVSSEEPSPRRILRRLNLSIKFLLVAGALAVTGIQIYFHLRRPLPENKSAPVRNTQLAQPQPSIAEKPSVVSVVSNTIRTVSSSDASKPPEPSRSNTTSTIKVPWRWITSLEEDASALPKMDPYYEPLRDCMSIDATIEALHWKNVLPQSVKYHMQRLNEQQDFKESVFGAGHPALAFDNAKSRSERLGMVLSDAGDPPRNEETRQAAIEEQFMYMLGRNKITDPAHIERLRIHLQTRLLEEARKFR